MSNKKNIDRLFQEKFKDFDVKPDPKVWQKIQSELNEEQEDKPVFILPFWLKLSGIAASVLLLMFIGKSIFNTDQNTIIPTVVNTEKLNKTKSKEEIDQTLNTTLDDKIKTSQDDSKTYKTAVSKTITTPKSTDKNKLPTDQKVSNNTNRVSSRAVKKSSYNNNNSLKDAQNSNPSTQSEAKNTYATTVKNSTKPTTVIRENTTKTENKSNTVITQNTTKTLLNNKESIVANTTVSETSTQTITDTLKTQKPSIEDAIAENIAKENDVDTEEKNSNKWVVNANIAPVYYNIMGEGSHLDEQFNDNNKSGEINSSYGVKIGYALNKKLTIRSGVNRLNLSYDTDDIIVYEKFSSSNSETSIGSASNLKNIDFVSMPSGQQLSMISASNVNTMEVSRSLNAAISQRMSYYEIPLELEYKLLDKRFGLHLIGGLSTFVLNDNQVVSELNGSKVKIGEANNINPVSFSTNIGVGLNFRFSDAVIFNVEPTFKYQLNTFNNTSGDFNPYIIGLYTGLNYRF